MDNLSVDDILLINQIAKYNSFVKAGDSLGIPKSSVSRRIKHIESYLGAKLFNRSGRNISLTHSAELILRHTQDIEAHWGHIVDTLKGASKHGVGVLKMRNLSPFNRLASKSIVLDMLKLYPKLKIEMYSTAKDPEADRFDVDLMFNSKPISSPKLTNEVVAVSKQIFVASPLYLEQYSNPISPRLLDKHKLIGSDFPDETKHQWCWKEGNQIFQANIDPYLILQEPESIIDIASAGQGIAWLPDCLCQQQIQNGELVSLFDTNMSIDSYLWAIYPNTAMENKISRKFIDLARESGRFGKAFDGDESALLSAY